MKLLLISNNSFSKTSNNGKTYEAILSNFGKNELAQLYFTGSERPDFDFCSSYYRMTDIDVVKSMIKLSPTCGDVLNSDLITEKKVENSKLENKIIKFVKKIISGFSRDMLWKNNRWNCEKLKKWYSEFAPDVILFVGGAGSFSTNIALHVSKDLNIPLVTFYTDDYVINSVKEGILHNFHQRRINNIYREVISHSKLRYVIGETMAKEYRKYFRCDFNAIMNSTPIEPYQEYPNNDRLTFSYFGGLHLGRWNMIVRLAKLLKGKVDINVYTMQEPEQEIRSAFKDSGVTFCGGVTGDNLKQKIRESDILLHIESDDKYMRKLTGMSVSTKIPEYLMSGRVVVGFGPTEVASMLILSDNNIGYVVSSDSNDDDIIYKFEIVLDDYNLRKEIGIKGYDYALKYFDNNKNSLMFKEKLKTILLL